MRISFEKSECSLRMFAAKVLLEFKTTGMV